MLRRGEVEDIGEIQHLPIINHLIVPRLPEEKHRPHTQELKEDRYNSLVFTGCMR